MSRFPKLTPEQKAQIPALLLRGAEAFGFSGDVWTCERIAAVIACELEVVYRLHYDQLSFPAPSIRTSIRSTARVPRPNRSIATAQI